MSIPLKEKINFLSTNFAEIQGNYEIQVTNMGYWSLSFESTDDMEEIKEKLENDPLLSYLKINNNVFINKPLFENIDGNIISRHNITFHQCDDGIRNNLYETINKELEYNNSYVLVGGEMYIFGVIFREFYKKIKLYSDYQTIIDDSISNGLNSVNLINYDTYDKPFKINSFIICNTSKHGLGNNLCNLLNKSNAKKLFIISCNKKSLDRDIKMLNYRHIKKIIIRTNYEVSFNVFEP